MDIDYVPIKASITHTEWKSMDYVYKTHDPLFTVLEHEHADYWGDKKALWSHWAILKFKTAESKACVVKEVPENMYLYIWLYLASSLSREGTVICVLLASGITGVPHGRKLQRRKNLEERQKRFLLPLS